MADITFSCLFPCLVRAIKKYQILFMLDAPWYIFLKKAYVTMKCHTYTLKGEPFLASEALNELLKKSSSLFRLQSIFASLFSINIAVKSTSSRH